MRVGLVCPYDLDVHGGVQRHVIELGQSLVARGHTVGVLAPGHLEMVPDAQLTRVGTGLPIRFNGSVARVRFGPRVGRAARTWIEGGAFDLLHIHEPVTPSVSVQALWAADIPVVATFHTAQEYPVMLGAATKTVVRRSMERVTARIAVSEEARRTLERYSGLDAEVIPNGIFVSNFAGHASAGPRAAVRLLFVGRVDEPRKGLEVLLRALPRVTAVHPNVELDVIGPGKLPRNLARLSRHSQVRFHGAQPDDVKARMMRSSDVFVAPNTHGESFGIILIEAMAAGAAVVASDLVAFEALLKPENCGVTFRTGDPSALAETLNAVLADPAGRERRRESAARAVKQYDWSVVSEQVEAVYARCVSRESS